MKVLTLCLCYSLSRQTPNGCTSWHMSDHFHCLIFVQRNSQNIIFLYPAHKHGLHCSPMSTWHQKTWALPVRLKSRLMCHRAASRSPMHDTSCRLTHFNAWEDHSLKVSAHGCWGGVTGWALQQIIDNRQRMSISAGRRPTSAELILSHAPCYCKHPSYVFRYEVNIRDFSKIKYVFGSSPLLWHHYDFLVGTDFCWKHSPSISPAQFHAPQFLRRRQCGLSGWLGHFLLR